jgi:hypothetical protein
MTNNVELRSSKTNKQKQFQLLISVSDWIKTKFILGYEYDVDDNCVITRKKSGKVRLYSKNVLNHAGYNWFTVNRFIRLMSDLSDLQVRRKVCLY